jgi:type II secretory pathway pseudopilin PulG
MKSASAFSLVEVVLALGVAAVAFTSIMGLFPLGLDMSRETHEETQAALIAQSILGDLRDDYQLGGTSHTNRRVLVTNVINLNAMINFAVGTNTPTNVLYLGFTNHTISDAANPGESGKGALVLRPALWSTNTDTNLSSAPLWFQNGSNGVAAVARVLVTGTFRLADPNIRQMTVLDVMVETPGSAASSNRVQYGFKGGFQ